MANSVDPDQTAPIRAVCSGSTLFAPLLNSSVMLGNYLQCLQCLRSLYGKQCGPKSDCSYRRSLFWVHVVCVSTKFVTNARQLFAADDFGRRHFQMNFFLGVLRVNKNF